MTATFLNRSTFISNSATLRQDPVYTPLDLTKSFSYQSCHNVSSLCQIGVSFTSPSTSSNASSPTYDQSVFFHTWLPFFQRAIQPIPLSIFNSSSDLENQYAVDVTLFAGVVLDATKYPNGLTYDVKLPSSMLAAPLKYQAPKTAMPPMSHLMGGSSSYETSGFAAIQVAVEESLINFLAALQAHSLNFTTLSSANVAQGASQVGLHVGTARGPYSELLIGNNFFLPCLLLVVGLEGLLFLFLMPIVEERLSGWKKWMEYMGMDCRAFWFVKLARMLLVAAPILVLAILVTALGGYWSASPMYKTFGDADADLEGGVSNGFLIMLGALYLFLYTICSMSYATMVSVISGSFLAAKLYPVLFLIAPIFASAVMTAPLGVRVVVALFPPVNLVLSVVEILRRKSFSVMGATDRVPDALRALPAYPLSASFAVFIFDSILYFGIAILVSFIRHRRAKAYVPETNDGISLNASDSLLMANPTNYSDDNVRIPLEATSLGSSSDSIGSRSSSMARQRKHLQHFEPREDGVSKVVVQAKNLEKIQKGKEEPIVAALNLEIEAGIFAFVGTGTSDILALLAGYDRASFGRVEIFGHDIYLPWNQILKSVSYCPQTDALFDDLSAREHLAFMAQLRGLSSYETEERIIQSLSDFQLTDVANDLVETYSAGQKRSLSVACALLAPCRVAFLDDPSRGMNIDQRRALWRVLLRKKHVDDVTIVLTTTCMEDVEVLADRIGVVHKGRLIREGSLEFLLREAGVQIKGDSQTIKVPQLSSSRDSLSARSSVSPTPVVSPIPLRLKHAGSGFDSPASSLGSSSSSVPPLNVFSEATTTPSSNDLAASSTSDPASSGSEALRDEISRQINAVESSSSDRVSISWPTFEDYLLRLQASLDDSCKKEEEEEQAEGESDEGASKWPVSLDRPAPRNAPMSQQVRQHFTKTALGGARNKPRLLCFVIFPLIICLISFNTARMSSGEALKDVPLMLAKYSIEAVNPVDIGIAQSIPAIIPFSAPSSSSPSVLLQAGGLLMPWSRPDFQPREELSEGEMNNLLWRAKHPRELSGGGVSFQAVGPANFIYNVAYNFSEVYSMPRLINWVNNAILTEVLRSNNSTSNVDANANRNTNKNNNDSGIDASSEIASDGSPSVIANSTDVSNLFLRVRSVPFFPRSNAVDKDHEAATGYNPATMSRIAGLIKGVETGFSFQLGTAIFIPSAMYAPVWTQERVFGFRGQFSRLGGSTLVYWIGTASWAGLRYLNSFAVILGNTAPFRIEFLQGPAFLFYAMSLLFTMLVTIAIVGVITRFTKVPGDASGISCQLLIFSSLLSGIFPSLGSALASSAPPLATFFKHFYYLVPTALFGQTIDTLAQTLIDNDFKRPTFGLLFHNCWSLALAQVLHIIFWTSLLAFIEFRRRKIEKKKEENCDHDDWPIDTSVVVTGGLPASSQVVSRKSHEGEGVEGESMVIEQEPVEDFEALSTAVISAKKLSLRHPKMPRRVVDDFSVMLEKGGSVSILGPSGSGKSTACQMLLGEAKTHSGAFLFSGLSAIDSKRTPLFQVARLGSSITPIEMSDAVTVKEQLEFTLGLRNHEADFDLKAATAAILALARLKNVANTRADALDHNAQKRLSAALATLTFEETIVLDEPTLGCDLASRNTIWEIIRLANLQQHKSLLVFTSNIDEAAALSTETGIIVNGQIVSRGSIQQMSASCSQGYELTVWLDVGNQLEREETSVALDDYGLTGAPTRHGHLSASARQRLSQIVDHLEENTLRPLVTSMFEVQVEATARRRTISVTYDVPQVQLLAPLFDGLNQACKDGRIVDFKLSQMSLTTAYRRLARQQLDDYSRFAPCSCCIPASKH